MSVTIVNPQHEAIELCGTLDGVRSALTDARQELKITVAENARELQHISPTLRSKLTTICAWLLDTDMALRDAEVEAGRLVDLIEPEPETEIQLRDLARMVLDVDRGIVDASDLQRRALDVAGELMEAL